jgi:Competence protein CoiA-like family
MSKAPLSRPAPLHPLAQDRDTGRVTSAGEALHGFYDCLDCGVRVVAKKGRQRRHHFAAVPASVPAWGACRSASAPESDKHRSAKLHVAAHVGDTDFVVACSKCDGPALTVSFVGPQYAAKVELTIGPFRVDVAVVDTTTGVPVAAIEVVHTHACDDNKLRHFRDANVPILEVSADDVLGLDRVLPDGARWQLQATLATQLSTQCAACGPCCVCCGAPEKDGLLLLATTSGELVCAADAVQCRWCGMFQRLDRGLDPCAPCVSKCLAWRQRFSETSLTAGSLTDLCNLLRDAGPWASELPELRAAIRRAYSESTAHPRADGAQSLLCRCMYTGKR